MYEQKFPKHFSSFQTFTEMDVVISMLAFLFICSQANCDDYVINNKTFPPPEAPFFFGTGTAAYQIEGAWNEDGKSPSIWDNLTHRQPDFITDSSNGDVACDSYHRIKEDVAILKDLGVNFYRFSLSWPRILPKGTTDEINQAGINYYKTLIQELKANGIFALVTLYHWDLPQIIQDQGGLLNESIATLFADYARVAFQNFAADVPYWLTFNEPKQVCGGGYGYGYHAPAIKSEGLLEYVCAHNLLKAHAAAYHVYDTEFKPTVKGRISITLDSGWHEPATNSTEDIAAQEQFFEFDLGWFANPVYLGDYPEIMKKRIAERSAGEGYNTSRLPQFTPEEIAFINGTHDFFGLNTYSSDMVRAMPDPAYSVPSKWADIGVETFFPSDWVNTTSTFIKITPWGMRKLLKYIKDKYDNPYIAITENGVSDNGTSLDDDQRIGYLQSYLSNVRDAMEKDEVQVVGYSLWSLMDNFEWQEGYTQKFGIYHVDFSSPNRTRTAKKSVDFYKKLLKTRCLVDVCE